MKQEPGCKITLDISVSPQAVKAAHAKAVKTINKEISLPGFRKGKAPESYVIEKYGKQIKQEWNEILLNTAFQEALNLFKIQPFNSESIKCTPPKELLIDQPTQFTVTFEASPQVPVIDLNTLTLPNLPRKPISKEDIDGVTESLQLYYAKWHEITDRPVQEGDYVDLDIDKLDEPKESICKDTRFVVRPGRMANWMKDLIIGLHLNESVEGVSEKENDSEDFKPTNCRITIKTIKTAELPELDDSLAQKAGAHNLEDLQVQIVADLNRRADQDLLEVLRNHLDKTLLEKFHFDIPATLIAEEIKERLNNATERFKKENVPEEEIESRKEALAETMPKEVDNAYRLYFLLYSFAKKHDIKVTKEEVAQELSWRLFGQWNDQRALDPSLEDIRNRIANQMVMTRCRDYIVGHVRHV